MQYCLKRHRVAKKKKIKKKKGRLGKLCRDRSISAPSLSAKDSDRKYV